MMATYGPRIRFYRTKNVESLKIYLLEICLGPVTPRNPSYKPPVPAPASLSASTSTLGLGTGANTPSPRRPLSRQPSLRVDTSRRDGSGWNGLTSPTSPVGVGSPTSLAGPGDPYHPHPIRATIRSSPGHVHRPLHRPSSFSRHASGSTAQTSTTITNSDNELIEDSDDSDYVRSPVFAARPEYDYTSDVPDWEDQDDLDSPERDHMNYDNVATAGGGANLGESQSSSVAEQRSGTRGILSTSGIRKATSRVTFKAHRNKRFVAHLTSVSSLLPRAASSEFASQRCSCN